MELLTKETSTGLKRAAIDALMSQDAPNASGVLFSFAHHMQTICDASNELNKGTEWKNTHPITIVFLDTLATLAGIGTRQTSLVMNAMTKVEAIQRGEAFE
jgi:hypothetical protein